MFWNYEVCRLMCESFADVFDSESLQMCLIVKVLQMCFDV
jgi:hypothetical protein